ncbi:SPP24 protein, partial [Rhinopomastus cyanomelas]|nr:SPP24 protein [Rhinopomastus cyanomelas]
MKVLVCVLTLSVFACSAFPVYDYVAEEALNASIARINAQSWGPNLYGVVRSHVGRVDMWGSDAYGLELQFSIRETVCAKHAGRDPSTCDFKFGPYVPTASCRSLVEVSGEEISSITVRCHRGTFSSESMSSEEMMHVPVPSPIRRGRGRGEEDEFAPDVFPSRGRGNSRGDWHKPSSFSAGRLE